MVEKIIDDGKIFDNSHYNFRTTIRKFSEREIDYILNSPEENNVAATISIEIIKQVGATLYSIEYADDNGNRYEPEMKMVDRDKVGYLTANIIIDGDRTICEISNIYVQQDYRRIGLGSYLLNRLYEAVNHNIFERSSSINISEITCNYRSYYSELSDLFIDNEYEYYDINNSYCAVSYLLDNAEALKRNSTEMVNGFPDNQDTSTEDNTVDNQSIITYNIDDPSVICNDDNTRYTNIAIFGDRYETYYKSLRFTHDTELVSIKANPIIFYNHIDNLISNLNTIMGSSYLIVDTSSPIFRNTSRYDVEFLISVLITYNCVNEAETLGDGMAIYKINKQVNVIK